MNEPLVSFIIPTFNRVNYLKRAINSVLNQTITDLELIIIDDNSKDNTENFVKGIKDSRLRYFKNRINRGPQFSRNKGIFYSKGKYINFLDDDDQILPNKTELQINKFKKSNIENLGAVVCDVEYNGGNINRVWKNRARGNVYKSLLTSFSVKGTESPLIEKEFTPYFDLNLKYHDEYDLFIQIAKLCNFDYVPEKLSIKYESVNQLSYNFKNIIDSTIYFFRKYKNDFKRFGLKLILWNYLRFWISISRNLFGLIFGKKIYTHLINLQDYILTLYTIKKNKNKI